MSTDPDLELVDRLLRHRGFEPVPGHQLERLLGGALVRLFLQRPDDDGYDRFELSLFKGIEGFAGELWEHEIRALLRLDALDHPALPTIVLGAFDPTERVAFTISTHEGVAVDAADHLARLRAEPVEALRHFSVLLDALSRLHGCRMLHRYVTPGAFRLVTDDGGREHLALTRFEMSTLLANVARGIRGADNQATNRRIRQHYLTPSAGVDLARHLAHLAPENHDYLFGEGFSGRKEWETTDVFGLGVLAWELFCGDLREQLPDRYAAVEQADEGQATVEALVHLHRAMRAHLTTRTDLAGALTDLLRDMLDPLPTGRRSSFDCARRLEAAWDTIRGVWDFSVGTRPLLVAFMPKESRKTLYEHRHWIENDPAEPEGRRELKDFLEKELARATLVHSPTGALGYAPGEETILRDAQWVLVGEQGVWFCAYLHSDALGIRELHDDVLVIKFVKERELAAELATHAQPRRAVGRLDLVPYKANQNLGEAQLDRPSWRPLTDSVKLGHRRSPEDELFLQSLDFLLGYQRVELAAGQYPFRREDDRIGPTALLRHDTLRDDSWRHTSSLLSAYTADRRRRPPLGDFLRQHDVEDETVLFDIAPSDTDRPIFDGKLVAVELVARRDENLVEVRAVDGATIPTAGWLRPQADKGSYAHLERQARARVALHSHPSLIRNLRKPRAIDLGRGRWGEGNAAQDDPDDKLEGNAPDIVRAMLSLHPFYALQGPPGTGKTRVAARVVRTYLEAEPGARVLVSAQSNFALDNLGVRLLKELEAHPSDHLLLREVSRANPEAVTDERVDGLRIEAVTENLVREIRAKLAAGTAIRSALEHGQGAPHEQGLVERWLASLEGNKIEMAERVRDGASVVLATCSVATTLGVGHGDPSDAFDWVIVEEAAKAWPTEIIAPLVRGVRWALIGDHRQLGAHRGDQVWRFLNSVADHEDEEISRHYDARHRHMAVLALFGSLFAGDDQADGGDDADPVALGRLTMQFRMAPTIAEPVSRAFYPTEPEEVDADGLPRTFLETYWEIPDGHEVVEPRVLAGCSLVWIDTGGRGDCQDEPRWSNPGEVALVSEIVRRMQPSPAPAGQDGPGSLVVLTPYQAQRRKLMGDGLLRGRVHTVHSFQGREADRVVVSLVRSTPRVARAAGSSASTVGADVGFLGQAEVINVLLSRARRLLVLVGNLAHFRDRGGESWRTVCATVERHGRVVTADDLEAT